MEYAGQINAQRRPRRRSWLIFLGAFLRSPLEVAALAPSSPKLPALLLDRIEWTHRRLIVELGPGTGRFTAALLEKMHPGATLVAIESNRTFCDHLRRRFRDPRLIVIHGSAADIGAMLDARGLAAADCIVSGLPFTSLPERDARRILTQCRARLASGGIFAAYQLRRTLRHMLPRYFGHVESEKVRPCLLPFELTWATREEQPGEKPVNDAAAPPRIPIR